MSYFVISNNVIIYSSILFVDSWLFATLYCGKLLIVGDDCELEIEGLIENENKNTLD